MRKRAHAARGLAVLVALVALAAPAPGAPARGAASAPGTVVVRLVPPAGPPGTVVAVSGVLPAGGAHPSAVEACWRGCGAEGLESSVPVSWSGDRFALAVQVPPFLWIHGQPVALPPGPLALRIACLAGTAPACLRQPAAQATFALTRGAPSVPWKRLPRAAAWYPLQPEAYPGFALGTTGGRSRVPLVATCAADPHSGIPSLAVSDDLGRRWRDFPLPLRLLGAGPGGTLGCRDLAVDPARPNTFYVAGLLDPETAVPQYASPPALYTTDGGRQWQLVPVPDGFSSEWGWTGFTVAPQAVVSWYSRAFFGAPAAADLFAAEVAIEGGAQWVPVPLVCPRGAPCAWRAAGLNPALNGAPAVVGVVASATHGATWAWASFSGLSLSGGMPVFAGQDLLWPGAVAWPRGTEGTPGGGLVAPLLYSPDGGSEWQWVQLPTPPGGWSSWGGAPPGPGDLRVLPDGALLLREWGGSPPGWLLRPGADAWCALDAVPGNGFFLEVGPDLAWLAAGALHVLAARSLTCAR